MENLNREKQIEEMAKYCCNACDLGNQIDLENNIIPCAIDNEYKTCPLALETATLIYTAGYRKQSEGEWYVNYMMSKKPSKRGRIIQYTTYTCSVCGKPNGRKKSNFCPNCGAKMKGGAE